MKTLLRSIFIILLLNGCIQSDLSDCPTEVSVHFEYTLNMSDQDRFKAEVNNISMYVFDENNLFVKQFNYETEETQTLKFDLNKGKYKLLFVGNICEQVMVPDVQPAVTRLEDFQISLKNQNQFVQDSSALFYGFIDDLGVNDFGASRTVSLRKNSKDIRVKMIYKPESLVPDRTRGNNGEMFIHGYNGAFNYRNEFTKEDQVHYMPLHSFSHFNPESNLYESAFAFCTLHLVDNVPLILSAINTNTGDGFNIDLMEILNKTPVDLVREDHINITINFTHNTSITILINDWKVCLNDGNIEIE